MPSSYLSQKNTADMNSDDNILKRQDEDNEDLLMRQSAPQFLIKDRGDDKSARSSAVSSETATESYNGKNRGNLMLSRDNSAFKSHFQINKKVAAGTTNSSNRIANKEFQHSRRRRSTRYSISHKVYPLSNTSNIFAKDSLTTGLKREIECSNISSSKQRRGSRFMPSRYSIARKIKKQQKEIEPQGNLNSISHHESILVPDNRQSEYHRLERKPWFIILPSNKFRIAWDIFMAWLLVIMLFFVPFRVCLYWEHDSTKSSGLFWFELLTEICFGIDIVMNFLTAFHDPNTKSLVYSPQGIIKRYLTGYFIFDLIATIPFSYILSSSNGNLIASKIGKLGRLPRMVRFLKAMRLLKLLRVYKLKDYISKLETDYGIHHGVTRLIKIISAVILVTHIAGCFWHLIGLTGGHDRLEGGWIYRYSFTEKSITVRYIASLYWSFSTLTTVGYGDIAGRTPQEQVYSMLMMLLGVSWYAYIVSSMATIMSTFDATTKAVREKMFGVNEFVLDAKLPHHLGRQVRSFFEFKLSNPQRVFLTNKHYDADEILYELGSSLRTEIMLYMERDLIAQIPFFENKVNQFVADTVSMLKPIIVQEGEFIVKEGSQADEMFFLTKGVASVFYGKKHILSLQEGSYFGEIGCLDGGIRRASVLAQTTCELQALSRKNLNLLTLDYPDIGDELRNVARERAKVVKQRNKNEQEDLDFQHNQIGHCKNMEAQEEEESTARLQLVVEQLVNTQLEEVMQQIKLEHYNIPRLNKPE